jgi:hypothetical protein
MKAYAEEKGIMNQKKTCLIGSMYGEKIMVIYFTFAEVVCGT